MVLDCDLRWRDVETMRVYLSYPLKLTKSLSVSGKNVIIVGFRREGRCGVTQSFLRC